jgi:hypothetical protein
MSTSAISDPGRARQGQTAIEFLTAISIVLLVFTALYTAVAQKQITVTNQQARLQADTVADTVAYELDLALTQGEGFSRTFQVREEIGGTNYSVDVRNRTVVVDWYDSVETATTATTNVTGDLGSGENAITNTGDGIEVVG